jgi:transposase
MCDGRWIMNILVIGSTSPQGREFVAQALGAGHAVRALARNPSNLRSEPRRPAGLMTIPGVGQLTALAFDAAIDDPSRIRRSRDIGAYFGLVPRRYQSGEVDYTGGISKCGDRRVRTLLYETAYVMLTRYKGQLKLKDWPSRFLLRYGL